VRFAWSSNSWPELRCYLLERGLTKKVTKTLRHPWIFSPVFILLLAACAPSAAPAPTPQVISVYASPATQPWLPKVYACAEQTSAIIRLSASSAVDIRLRLGEPENSTAFAYQIDNEGILIVANSASSIQELTADEVRRLFSQGQDNAQVWVFAASEEVQQIFSREIMHETSISSLARLAASPKEMEQALNTDKNAIGILPKHWKTGAVRSIYTLPSVPVLVLTPVNPQGAVKEILACLQK
jgi:hypothetical protein